MMINKKNTKMMMDMEIERILLTLTDMEIGSDEYKETIENLDKLNKMKNENSINRNTILTVAGSLLGIALILGAERTGIVTSKALGFVTKGRV